MLNFIYVESMLNLLCHEQDKSSNVEVKPPMGVHKQGKALPQMRERKRGLQNKREQHIILTKYKTLNPTDVSEMLQTYCDWSIQCSISLTSS